MENTRHDIPKAMPCQAEYDWLVSMQEQYERNPRSLVAQRMLDNAEKRYEAAANYYQALESDNRGRNEPVADAAATNADLLASDATPTDIKDFLVLSAIVIGAAILSGATAGAAGAVLVKEVVSKEVIKGAVAGLITSTATIAMERVMARRTQGPDRSSAAAPPDRKADHTIDLPESRPKSKRQRLPSLDNPMAYPRQPPNPPALPDTSPSILTNIDPEIREQLTEDRTLDHHTDRSDEQLPRNNPDQDDRYPDR